MPSVTVRCPGVCCSLFVKTTRDSSHLGVVTDQSRLGELRFFECAAITLRWLRVQEAVVLKAEGVSLCFCPHWLY